MQICNNRLRPNISITCSAPWHYVDLNGKCMCAFETTLIKCTDEGTLLRIGYCTTYTEGDGLSMSRCPYLKMKRHTYTTVLNDLASYPGLPMFFNVSRQKSGETLKNMGRPGYEAKLPSRYHYPTRMRKG